MQFSSTTPADVYVPDKIERYGSGPEEEVEEIYGNPILPSSGLDCCDTACNDARQLGENLDTLRESVMLERMQMQHEREELRAENEALRAKVDALGQSLLSICDYYSQRYRPCGSDLAELVGGLYRRGYTLVGPLS